MKTKFFVLIFFISILVSMTAHAEYRVYQYLIKNRDSVQDRDVIYKEVSTLNPVAYVAYNGGSEAISVDLIRTWICPGYTGGKKEYCSSPYMENIETSELGTPVE
ncbi:MAG: hypothetical protein JNM93_11330 [Bacteriovoracaceae bacterium]|nr:hypothetical protein [Bacteriovoracaceae bacterium]